MILKFQLWVTIILILLVDTKYWYVSEKNILKDNG
jgi:hypothetical protein